MRKVVISMAERRPASSVLVAPLLVLCACSSSYLAGSGTVGPTSASDPPEERGPLASLYKRILEPPDGGDEFSPKEADHEDGEAVLNAVFHNARNPKLADVVVYLPSPNARPLIFLMQDGQMVRVLNRESQLWVVTLAEKSGGVCPKLSLKLEGVGVAQLSPTVSQNDAISAMLARKDMEQTALTPKEFFVKTAPRRIEGLGKEVLCFNVQRFELSPNSVNRLVVTPGEEETPAKPQKVEIVNLPASLACAPCRGARDASSDCKAATPDAGSQNQADAEPERPLSNFNFANSRIPPHFGSIAIGFHPRGFGNGNKWCTDAGWCRPSIYAFGYLHTWVLDSSWDIPQRLSFSFPVIGLRMYEPLFGDIVGGLRLGAEEGLSKSLSRFGVIVGFSYVFRDFSKDERIEERSTMGKYRWFTAVDFAF